MINLEEILGQNASLLTHTCKTIDKSRLHLPGSDFIERVMSQSDRPIGVLKNMSALLSAGRLKNTGYVNILPVDQGIEHSAGASFGKNPDYFDPENIVKLAIEGGCNALATSLGNLSSIARKYAHKFPLILKINHNETLSFPGEYDQVLFAEVEQAFDMGCVGIGATVYWGSEESKSQLSEIKEAFYKAHDLGLVCILWCYLRNEDFKTDEHDYHTAVDLTGQANYLGATLGADIVKQKMPTNLKGFVDLDFSHTSSEVYEKLTSPNPIDLTRYQLANCYMGRVGLINSGGPSGSNDLAQAVLTAVINKRAGGMGLISGRKAFQKPLKEGIQILNAIQDVYLDKNVTIA